MIPYFRTLLGILVLILTASGATHFLRLVVADDQDAIRILWNGLLSTMCFAAATGLLWWVPRKLSFRALEEDLAETRRVKQLSALNETLRDEVERQRRLTAESMRQAERLKLALRAGGMGVWDWDFGDDHLLLNEKEQQVIGVQRASISSEEFFSRVAPEDRKDFEQRLRECIDHGRSFEHEFRFQQDQGNVRWLAGRGEVRIDASGMVVGMHGVNFDVTDRRLQEQETNLKTLALEAALNGVVILAVDAGEPTIHYANPEFSDLTGMQREDLLGQPLSCLKSRVVRPSAYAEFSSAIVSRTEAEVMLQLRDEHGNSIWCEVRTSPVSSPTGEDRHCVAVFSDITERVEYERELQHTRAAALKASAAKSEFLANMSHEIRTPLTAILGCADILVPKVNDETTRDVVQVIRNQGKLLLGIVNDVLDLSKIEAGRLTLLKEPTSIVSVVSDVCSTMRPIADDKGVELDVEFAKRLPAHIETDPLRVRQILANLVSNAIKFTDRGEVQIVVECDLEAGEARLLLSVTDTGVGIPQDKLNAIFQAFAQEHGELNRRVGGTGLGLTICQRLTQMLGGNIWVESKVGEGSRFTVALPLEDAARLTLRPIEELCGVSSSEVESLIHSGRMRGSVLVVEDTRSIQFTLRRMLSELVDRIEVVGNGLEAIEAVTQAARQQNPFDLILMDIQMPKLDGYAATKHLRGEGYGLPIIALTAGALEGDRDRCLQAGCTDYLPKPIVWERLRELLYRYLPVKSKLLTGGRNDSATPA